MSTDKQALDQADSTLPSRQSSATGSPKDNSAPHHVLHEVAVQADGTEDPGAGIEQMVESRAESGSSLIHANAPDAAAPLSPTVLEKVERKA
jgi:hypothetical protein